MKKTRIDVEAKTVQAMIEMYCKNNHSNHTIGKLCEECNELVNYSKQRVLNCKFKEKKPICGKCKIHCYKPDMKVKIKNVMRYSGPRMIYKHPIMMIKHVIDFIIY